MNELTKSRQNNGR